MNTQIMSGNWTNQFETLQEKLFLGTSMALVGFFIVFILLISLILCISAMSGILTITNKKNNLSDNSNDAIVKNEITTNDEGEIAAVVTAAIYSYLTSGRKSQDAPYPGFRVKKIRRM